MIPTFDEVDIAYTVDYDRLWDVSAEEVAYGIGINHDYQPQLPTNWHQAEQAAAAERQWINQLDELDIGHDRFEQLAEHYEDDDFNDGAGECLFNLLDVGVAGLVQALAAARFVPWTSCRGHTDGRGFPYPQGRIGG